MKVLITGGAGFVGRATARTLLELNEEVLLFDSLQDRVHPNGPPLDLPVSMNELHVRDVRDKSAWLKLLPQCDAVLHLAAYQDYQPDYGTFFDINVTSTALLYEVAHEIGWRGQVVVASSSSTLGEGAYVCASCTNRFVGAKRQDAHLTIGAWEMTCPRCNAVAKPVSTYENEWFPVTPYGASKQAEEQTALTIGRMLNIPTVALRYSIIQGAGQSPWNAYSGVMRATCLQILAGNDDIVMFEDGKQLRDYVSIHDVVDANIRALRGELPSNGYSIGGGGTWSVQELTRTMLEIAGQPNRRITTPGLYRVGDVRHNMSALDRITTASDWRPTHSSRIADETWPEYWHWLASLNLPAGDIVHGAFMRMKVSGVLRQAHQH